MDLSKKVERIKAEIAFLIEGGGTVEEKKAAVTELSAYADSHLTEQALVEASKPAE